MTNSDSSLPLFVDVDGTLIKSDLMFESVLVLLKRNLVYLLLIPFWLLKGRAFLKHQLAQRIELPVERLPLNEEFLAYLVAQKNAGRSITLISGSNQASVTRLGNYLKLFDATIGSDTQTNLKAAAKLQRIQELNTGGFGYAGNSSADLPVWTAAQQVIMVNCNDALVKRLGNDTILRFDTAASSLQKLWQAMRPHQWLKNLLVFVPLVLSHQANQIELLMLASIGFISFSLCASSVYLLNDMLDLNSDRQHHSKSQRPFASGELPLAAGFLAVPGLLLVAFAVALLLPTGFLAMLFSYWLLTSLYSLFLKRLFLVDVFTLAVLYTMRIAAGAAAISVITTNFLIAFS
ncbi:MAG: UbiA family prenyltransferase, partial [Gammaproteobacteria bacterium]|nr:UbiA family prenyltransferase [Gammaproteobacteria bacterium]